MTPEIARPAPPYMQVTDHYRQLIQDNELTEGSKLPTVAEIAKSWKIAHATAAKAIAQLQVEGLIVSSPRGSFVSGKAAKASTPHDRLMRLKRTGNTSAQHEWHRVTAAETVTAPAYVADLLDIEPGSNVIRREWITGDVDSTSARALTVTWYPGAMAEQVPALLDTEPDNVGTLLSDVERIVGPVHRGRDFYHARGADQREAGHLGLPTGAPILAGAWLVWADDERLVEYGETCLPPRHTVSYPYDIAADGA